GGEDVAAPAARERGGVGAEEDAFDAEDAEGAAKDGFEGRPHGLDGGPGAGRRRVAEDVAALRAGDERLAEEARAEVGDHEGHGRERVRGGDEVEGVREGDVVRA